MPKNLTVAEYDAFDFEEVRLHAHRGLRTIREIAAVMGFSYQSVLDARFADETFRNRWEEAVAVAHAEALGKLLDRTWAKAISGDLKAIEMLMSRVEEPEPPPSLQHPNLTMNLFVLPPDERERVLNEKRSLEAQRRALVTIEVSDADKV